MKGITEIRLLIVKIKIQGVYKTHRVKCTTGNRLSVKVNITEIRLSIVKIQGVPKKLQT